MKLRINDIKPNPFRHMRLYQINQERVEELKASIYEHGFWDNFMVRQHPTKKGKYQLVYGHHRLAALKALGVKETGEDIPCKEFSDSQMLKQMAQENITWDTSTANLIQTVITTKEFLDAELAKYKTWEDLSNKSIRQLFESEAVWRNTKSKGAGQTTILKFLGRSWKQWVIQEALASIKDENVDQEAIKIIPTLGSATKFRKAVADYAVPKEEHKRIAKKIKDEKIGERDIRKTVLKHSKKKEVVKDPELEALENTVDIINKQAKSLDNKIREFKVRVQKYEVTSMDGQKLLITALRLKRLTETINSLSSNTNIKQIEGEVE